MTTIMESKRTRSSAAQAYHVLLLETNIEEAKMLLPLAERIALDRQGKITILSVLFVPEGGQISGVAKKASRLREELKTYFERTPIPTRIKSLVRTEEDVWEGVHETVLEEKIQLMLTHWSVTNLDKGFRENLSTNKIYSLPCDVALVRPSNSISGVLGKR